MKKSVFLMVLAMSAAIVNAMTVNIAINEGLNGSDGFASQSNQGGGSIGSTEAGLRIGYGMNAVAQTYFMIPDELKAVGVMINSATISMEFGDFYPGGVGIDYQMLHLNYDTGTVSYENANATNAPSMYTKVGDFAHMQGSNPSFVTSWDITSVLTADIIAGNTYLPLAVRMTRNDGTFYPDSEASNSYYGLLWASEHGSGAPVITVSYTVVPEPACMLLMGVGGILLRRHRFKIKHNA